MSIERATCTPDDPEVLRYLEAAYLYYLHPELGIELMSDAEWDHLGSRLEDAGKIERAGSLFYLREADYPKSIRVKHAEAVGHG